MRNMVTIFSPGGRGVAVCRESVAGWLQRGWSTEAPGAKAAPKRRGRAKAKLPAAVASKQASDVTAPGE